MSISVVFCRYRQSQFDLNTKGVQYKYVRDVAEEKNVASNLGVLGSRPQKKPTILAFKCRRKAIKMTKKT